MRLKGILVITVSGFLHNADFKDEFMSIVLKLDYLTGERSLILIKF